MSNSTSKMNEESISPLCTAANNENEINEQESAIFPSTNDKILNLDPTINRTLCEDVWNRIFKIESKGRDISDSAKDSLREMAVNESNEQKRRNLFQPVMDFGDQEIEEELNEQEIKDIHPIISDNRKFGKSIRRLLKLVSKAFLNPIYIPWDVEDYYWDHVKGGRDKNRRRFPNPGFGSFSTPLTVVDVKGRIVLWYLPGLIPTELQSSIRNATVSLAPLLKKSIKSEKSNNCKRKKTIKKAKLDLVTMKKSMKKRMMYRSTPNWRIKDSNFINKTSVNNLEPGSVNFSSGWYAQGHEGMQYNLKPSRNLRTHRHLGTTDWMQLSTEFEKLLNLTLLVIHPDLFKTGLDMLQKLREFETTREIAQNWQSVYNGIAVISNRTTPSHRDRKGRPEWFDLLLNYSNGGANPRLLINDLGLDLDYSSGTVVGVCGSIFQHEVPSWGMGDRVCYAHFLREAVRKRLDATAASWVFQDTYLPGCIL